jgi:hypothetical protein
MKTKGEQVRLPDPDGPAGKKTNQVGQAALPDLESMLDLSETKRDEYQTFSPVFHRAASDACDRQRPYFESAINSNDAIVLVSGSSSVLDGFAIATFVQATPVYDPGGATCVIDDFVVSDSTLWTTVGAELLAEVQSRASKEGAAQTVVVCSPRDEEKHRFLANTGYHIVSEWFTKPLPQNVADV